MSGFTSGFSVGHTGVLHDDPKKNSRIAESLSEVARGLVDKEISAGRVAGPFKEKPFTDAVISPLSLREKKTPGEYRLIHDLSFPYDHTSINSCILDDNRTVHYQSVNDAIDLILKFGRGSYLAKTDIKSAFRLIPILPSEYHLFTFKIGDSFYFDKCLQMGCSSSCQIFEKFSSSIHWILVHKFGVKGLVHYMDDFLFVAPSDMPTFENCIQ